MPTHAIIPDAPAIKEDRMLTESEAAEVVGLSPRTLRCWRSAGDGPTFVKLGDTKYSRVRYRMSDLQTWIRTRKAQQ